MSAGTGRGCFGRVQLPCMAGCCCVVQYSPSLQLPISCPTWTVSPPRIYFTTLVFNFQFPTSCPFSVQHDLLIEWTHFDIERWMPLGRRAMFDLLTRWFSTFFWLVTLFLGPKIIETPTSYIVVQYIVWTQAINICWWYQCPSDLISLWLQIIRHKICTIKDLQLGKHCVNYVVFSPNRHSLLILGHIVDTHLLAQWRDVKRREFSQASITNTQASGMEVLHHKFVVY